MNAQRSRDHWIEGFLGEVQAGSLQAVLDLADYLQEQDDLRGKHIQYWVLHWSRTCRQLRSCQVKLALGFPGSRSQLQGSLARAHQLLRQRCLQILGCRVGALPYQVLLAQNEALVRELSPL